MPKREGDKDAHSGGEDLLAIGPKTGDGYSFVRRKPDHTVHAGVLRPLKEGENLTSEAVLLHPREDGLYEVESLMDSEHSGPCKANSEAFRDGWETTFGKRTIAKA